MRLNWYIQGVSGRYGISDLIIEHVIVNYQLIITKYTTKSSLYISLLMLANKVILVIKTCLLLAKIPYVSENTHHIEARLRGKMTHVRNYFKI